MTHAVVVAACHLCHGTGSRMGGFCWCGTGRRLAAFHDYRETPEAQRIIVLEQPITDADPGDEA